jgi:uncharacterized membrane protein
MSRERSSVGGTLRRADRRPPVTTTKDQERKDRHEEREESDKPRSRGVDVDVPVTVAYNQWTQFEGFRSSCRCTRSPSSTAKRLYWRAEVAKDKEWTAEIAEQVPDQVIAWHSTTGARNAGRVQFFPIGPASTRIQLTMDYDPEGAVENVGDWVGLVTSRVKGDLRRFKEFIESRGVETGAWRGRIHGGHES